MFKFFFLFSLCIFPFQKKLVAQTKLEAETIITVDKIIGPENTGLYNGIKYLEQFRTINERHKFFLSSNFTTGDIVYNDQYYGSVNLKYDLYADDILLDIGYKWNFPILKLYKERISEFNLDGKRFINVGNEHSKTTKGFHEVLWSSKDLLLLKKHRKKKYKRFFKTVIYFEFDEDNSYYFHYQDTYHTLSKKSDLIRVFPQLKKEVNKLYDRKLIKINPEANLILIFGELQKYLENDTL